ncbi:MaoC family dehydratase [Prosthecodimorpha staleyi]|uniref:MaoC family dehydratase n=1 Tax=Prosthecodimorpha staleyi TaxID=2840188 RepID=A0A947D4A0_9HYPH|nr:MaoC family dehydratase [Prosthecodimorpha staleyi]MBT9289301.1 MaoC family dehydratase [Prosthecodimorpha staleyi]
MTDNKISFDDFEVGRRIELGSKDVTRDEVIAFAAVYDAQPMHLDDSAARDGMLGALSASGWHTIAMFMRLLCDNLLLKAHSLGSPGIDKVRWLRPVFPGDRLTAVAEVVETRASKSRPDLGIVRFRFTVSNQAGEAVMTMENPIMFATREAAA